MKIRYILFCVRWLWKNRNWESSRQKYKAMDREWKRKEKQLLERKGAKL